MALLPIDKPRVKPSAWASGESAQPQKNDVATIKSKVADAARNYGVDPGLLLGLIDSESGFKQIPNAQGSGAYGIGQFTSATAKQYGVDRNDTDSQIEGAAHLMSDLMARNHNDPAAAIRAYKGVDAGGATEKDVRTALDRAQQYGYGGAVKPSAWAAGESTQKQEQPSRQSAPAITPNVLPKSIPSFGQIEAADVAAEKQAPRNQELWGIGKGLPTLSMPSSSTGVVGHPQTASILTTRPADDFLSHDQREAAQADRAHRVEQFEQKMENSYGAIGIPLAEASEFSTGALEALPGGALLKSLVFGEDARKDIEAIGGTPAGRAGSMGGTIASFGLIGRGLKALDVAASLEAPLTFGGATFLQSGGEAVGQFRDINTQQDAGQITPDQASKQKEDIVKGVLAQTAGSAVTGMTLGPLAKQGQELLGIPGRAAGGAAAFTAGELTTNVLQGKHTDIADLTPSIIMGAIGEGLGAFGHTNEQSHAITTGEEEYRPEYQNGGASGQETVASQSDSPQRSTEIGSENTAQAQVAPIVEAVPAPTPEQNLAVQDAVVSSDGIQAEPIGRTDAGDHGAQSPGVGAGVRVHEESGPHSAEGQNSRPVDYQSDRGDESARNGRPQEAQGAAPEPSGQTTEVGVRPRLEIGDRAAAVRVNPDDFLHETPYAEGKIAKSYVVNNERYYEFEGSDQPHHESVIRSREEPPPDVAQEKTLTEKQLFNKRWNELQADAPGSAYEATHLALARRASFHIDDVEKANGKESRFDKGTRLQRSQMFNKRGQRIDDFVHNDLPEILGYDTSGESGSDQQNREIDWTNQVHQAIEDVNSRFHAKQLLVEQYEKRFPTAEEEGVPLYDRTASAVEDDSFNFGANAEPEVKGEPIASDAKAEEPTVEPIATEPNVTPPTEQPTTEAESRDDNNIGIKNAINESEREKYGLPPLEKRGVYTDEQAHADADVAFKGDPHAGEKTVDALKSSDRVPTKLEDAILSREMGRRAKDVEESTAAVPTSETDFDYAEAKSRQRAAQQRFNELSELANKKGYEAAISLQGRKAEIDRNRYTLASVRQRVQALLPRGMEIPKEWDEKIQELSSKLRASDAELGKLRDQIADQELRRSNDQHIAQIASELQRLTSSPKGKEVRRKLNAKLDQLDKEADAALKRLASQAHSGIDLASIAEYVAKRGAVLVARGAIAIEDWLAKVVADLRAGGAAHMISYFKENAKQLFDQASASAAQTMSGITDEEPALAGSDKVLGKLVGKEALTGTDVFHVARALLNEGVAKEDVLRAAHEALQYYFPDLSEREVREKFSGYGSVRYPPKAEDLKTLRQLRSEEQSKLALEDLRSDLPAKRSGAQREPPSDLKRQLIKEVHEELKKRDIGADDPKYLKSANQIYKDAIKHRTEDIRARIETAKQTGGLPPKRVREQRELDNEAFQLLSQNTKAKRELDAIEEQAAKASQSKTEKFIEGVINARRAFLLTGVNALAKIPALDVFYHFILTPIMMAAHSIRPELADVAGLPTWSDWKYSNHVLKTEGMAQLRSALAGKPTFMDEVRQQDYQSQPAWKDPGGFVHKALKAPVYTAQLRMWERSLTRKARADGLDISRLQVLDKIHKDASEMAQHSIALNANYISDVWRGSLKVSENLQKKHGPIGERVSQGLQFIQPFMRVPVNVAKMGIDATGYGAVRGVWKYATTPEIDAKTARLIIKHVALGTPGVLAMTYGFFNPQSNGGLYVPGIKQDENDLKPEEFAGLGKWGSVAMSHNPWGFSAMLGSTIRRVHDDAMNKGDAQGMAYAKGLFRTGIAAATKVPLFALPQLIGDLASAQGWNKATKTVQDIVVPQGAQQIYKMVDPPVKEEKEVSQVTQTRREREKDYSVIQKMAAHGSFENKLDWYERLSPERQAQAKPILRHRILDIGVQGSRTDEQWHKIQERASALLGN